MAEREEEIRQPLDWAFKTESRSEAQERYRTYVDSGVAQQPQIDTRAFLTAHQTHGYRLAEIAAFLGIHSSTASKALRRAREDRAKAAPE